MIKSILFGFVVMPYFLFSQHTISVNVYNVHSASGDIKAAIYGSDDAFLTYDGAIKAGSASAQTGKVTLKIENLSKGEYALAVFHDENGNGKLDTNWLGFPKEKVAFSKGKMRSFGPPRYEDCTFTITSDYEIDTVL